MARGWLSVGSLLVILDWLTPWKIRLTLCVSWTRWRGEWALTRGSSSRMHTVWHNKRPNTKKKHYQQLCTLKEVEKKKCWVLSMGKWAALFTQPGCIPGQCQSLNCPMNSQLREASENSFLLLVSLMNRGRRSKCKWLLQYHPWTGMMVHVFNPSTRR